MLEITERFLRTFGFDNYQVHLSTRPEGEGASVGSDEAWEQATGALTEALAEVGWEYLVDEGEGAFYGPKIDVGVTDAIGEHRTASSPDDSSRSAFSDRRPGPLSREDSSRSVFLHPAC